MYQYLFPLQYKVNILIRIHLTLEQHRLEPRKYTYTRVFFLIVSKYCMTHSWLNLRVWKNQTQRANRKLYMDFQQCRGSEALNPTLFKD